MSNLQPQDLICHSGDMLLIDRILSISLERVVCRVRDKHAPFANSAGETPSYVALEYMCQAIAALGGFQRRTHGKPPVPGFLLGTRKLVLNSESFSRQQTLQVSAEVQMENAVNLGVYASQVTDEQGEVLASSVIKAVMPENPDSVFLRGNSV